MAGSNGKKVQDAGVRVWKLNSSPKMANPQLTSLSRVVA